MSKGFAEVIELIHASLAMLTRSTSFLLNCSNISSSTAWTALIVSVLASEHSSFFSNCLSELRAVLPLLLMDGDFRVPLQAVDLSCRCLGSMWSFRKEFNVWTMCGFVCLICISGTSDSRSSRDSRQNSSACSVPSMNVSSGSLSFGLVSMFSMQAQRQRWSLHQLKHPCVLSDFIWFEGAFVNVAGWLWQLG